MRSLSTANGVVRPYVVPSYIHHSFPVIAANFPNWLRHSRSESLFIRAFRPKIARSPQVRNNHSTVFPPLFLSPVKIYNNYTRRCNYCGRLRSVAVNNEKAVMPIIYFSRGRKTRHIIRCSDITNLSWNSPFPRPVQYLHWYWKRRQRFTQALFALRVCDENNLLAWIDRREGNAHDRDLILSTWICSCI